MLGLHSHMCSLRRINMPTLPMHCNGPPLFALGQENICFFLEQASWFFTRLQIFMCTPRAHHFCTLLVIFHLFNTLVQLIIGQEITRYRIGSIDAGTHKRQSWFTGISRELAFPGALGGVGRLLVWSILEERVDDVAEVAVGTWAALLGETFHDFEGSVHYQSFKAWVSFKRA